MTTTTSALANDPTQAAILRRKVIRSWLAPIASRSTPRGRGVRDAAVGAVASGGGRRGTRSCTTSWNTPRNTST
jgi:hypothetical protein